MHRLIGYPKPEIAQDPPERPRLQNLRLVNAGPAFLLLGHGHA